MNGITWSITGVKRFAAHPQSGMYQATTTDKGVLVLFTHNYDKVQLWDVYDHDETITEMLSDGQIEELEEIVKGFYNEFRAVKSRVK